MIALAPLLESALQIGIGQPSQTRDISHALRIVAEVSSMLDQLICEGQSTLMR
jgi:hypothetical protein